MNLYFEISCVPIFEAQKLISLNYSQMTYICMRVIFVFSCGPVVYVFYFFNQLIKTILNIIILVCPNVDNSIYFTVISVH